VISGTDVEELAAFDFITSNNFHKNHDLNCDYIYTRNVRVVQKTASY
jgi:hypothetical protein